MCLNFSSAFRTNGPSQQQSPSVQGSPSINFPSVCLSVCLSITSAPPRSEDPSLRPGQSVQEGSSRPPTRSLLLPHQRHLRRMRWSQRTDGQTRAPYLFIQLMSVRPSISSTTCRHHLPSVRTASNLRNISSVHRDAICLSEHLRSLREETLK